MEHLTEQEISFMEMFCDPVALIENLIPKNIDAPQLWSEDCDCLSVLNYQFGFLNYSYLYADDFTLSDEQNFKSKIKAGQVYNISARNIGKSLIGIDSDGCIMAGHFPASEVMLASFDDKHLNDRADRIAQLFENHKFFKMYHLTGQKKTVNRGHKFKIQASNGFVMKGANEHVGHPKVGEQFHGLHSKVLLYDEASYMSEEGTKKRIDSVHPFGQIERFSGIPDLKVGSPLGRILADPKKQKWIVRLPQFVREDWSPAVKAQKIEEFEGEESPGYKLNVVGELLEGAKGKFDIARIKEQCVNNQKNIKYLELGKAEFKNFEKLLVVERIPCDIVHLNADIGTTGSQTEITIIFGMEGKYKYHYNISLFYLTIQEQAKVFKYLYDKLGSCIVSIDATSDGKTLCDELVILGIPEKNIVRCGFNEKMTIGFEMENGQVKRDDNGNPIEKKERTIVFANQRLEKLFYNGLIEIPNDHKFLKEFSQYFSVFTGTMERFGSSTTDHLLQSFQCFAIAQFLNEQNTTVNQRKKRNLGVIG